ncbi:MAG TPA: CDP-alcohol phosphatidyltransferase family protein [Steroidobacteraceae bacterium]|nr:CDP-alcohol phosphatidyltransferase family protein [Steroidobacteraceae bacterium]
MRHLPNLICLIRIGLVWPIAVALQRQQYFVSTALFIAAAVSDGADGYLAKRFGWTSELGKALDPLADKVLLMTLFIECAWLGLVPPWVTAAAVARDVLIVLGAIVYRLWIGPLHGRPTAISKANTGAQLLYLLMIMINAAVGFPPAKVLAALAVIVLITTLSSGASYCLAFTRRAWSQPVRSS